jgi:hypothetical protein
MEVGNENLKFLEDFHASYKGIKKEIKLTLKYK